MSPAAQDRALVAAWVQGWALSRGLAPPVAAHGGWRVEVGLPEQRRRFVFAEVSDGVAAAAQANREPHVLIKVCAAGDSLRARLPPDWAVVATSTFMTTRNLLAQPISAPGYRLRSARDGAAWRVQVDGLDGSCAASGRMIRPSADDAVFDRIETDLAHRRRGLGRAVMAELTRIARAEGASRGLLVATADGRALYETMGWTVQSPYATAIWVGG